MVNKTCLCTPPAYPISATIAVVRNLTELNGSGTFTELPDTRLIAIASPIALPTPSTTAVMIPGSQRQRRGFQLCRNRPERRCADVDNGRKDHDRQHQDRRQQIGSARELMRIGTPE